MHTNTATPVSEDPEYHHFLRRMRDDFEKAVDGEPALFETDAQGVWETFLAMLPTAVRQFHVCHACRQFVERFGHLVTIDEHGRTRSPFWAGGQDDTYADSFAACARLVARAKVTGVHVSSQAVWGMPKTGAWQHMAVVPPRALVFNETRLKAAHEVAAEKREEYGMVQRALADFSANVVNTALSVLQADALYRGDKVLGPVQFLADLHAARGRAAGPRVRENVVWRAVAKAPAGFAHVRASMAGTLLEDIAAGLPFATVAEKFKAKIHPLQYQRPQAAPKAGAIARAEEVFAKLGLAPALERRYAKLEELQTIWSPRPPRAVDQQAGPVFGHLKPRGRRPAQPGPVELPEQHVTWAKFVREVLGGAEEIHYDVPYGHRPYCSFVTAANADAPKILQWDNPVSWYLWHGGSLPHQFNLHTGVRVKVTGVTLMPHLWEDVNDAATSEEALREMLATLTTRQRRYPHHEPGVVFLLDGCRDTRGGHLGLFPECLRGELHEVRSVVEAHCKIARPTGGADATGCGILFQGKNEVRVRVTSKDGSVVQTLVVDRWD